MLLVIDAGNTNIVFAVYEGETMLGEWRFSTSPERTADELGVWLVQVLALQGIRREDITAAIIATVVPSTIFTLKTLCRQYLHCAPSVVGDEGIDLGISILVDSPEEVGADRLVNAVAAHECYAGPLIVVDFGTATTFDVVDRAGNYCGGAIVPGVNLSLQALHMAAAKLPRVAIGRPKQVIGKGTVSAMRSGIFWGYVGIIEGMVERIQKEFGEQMTVVATGGLAPLFMEETKSIHHLDLSLTLRGLVSIYRRNFG